MIYTKFLQLFAVSAAVLLTTTAFAAEFRLLGKLRSTDQFSDAYAVSADGSTVVGVSFGANGYEAVRWTLPGAIQSLGAAQPSTAQGVSADGSHENVFGPRELTVRRLQIRLVLSGKGLPSRGLTDEVLTRSTVSPVVASTVPS